MSNLRNRRVSYGFSQKQLAGIISTTQTSISLWESNKRSPNKYFREALSRTLGGMPNDYRKMS